jgi:hypothetical protein
MLGEEVGDRPGLALGVGVGNTSISHTKPQSGSSEDSHVSSTYDGSKAGENLKLLSVSEVYTTSQEWTRGGALGHRGRESGVIGGAVRPSRGDDPLTAQSLPLSHSPRSTYLNLKHRRRFDLDETLRAPQAVWLAGRPQSHAHPLI